jgi:hypothetical protein
MIGHKSRSTLYRWLTDGLLAHAGYLRGREGAWRIETHPEDLRPFKEWAAAICGPQGPRRQSDMETSPWDHIPEPLRAVDGSEPFWCRYGQVAGPDDPPLTEPERWEQVWRIVGGMMGCDVVDSPDALRELHRQIEEALDDVEAGARWDEARWNRANVEEALPDMPCPATGRFLRELLEAGKVPVDLVPTVEAVLAAA